MERGKSKGLANGTGEVMAADTGTTMIGGSTKAIEVTAERSES
jgi:hypothetical protein